MPRSSLRGGFFVAALLWLVPALAADPQPYTVTLEKTGDGTLDGALAQSATLVSLRESAPAGPFALIARAQDDVGRLVTALRSFGYYKGRAVISIAGHPLDDPGLPDLLDRTAAGSVVPVVVTFDLGPLFHLRRVAVAGEVPPAIRAKFALAPGQPAVAATVLAAQDGLLRALQDDGYALAKVGPLAVTEVAEANALDVIEPVTSGPRVDLGPISLTGLTGVNQSYVRRRLLLHPGEQYSPAAIEKARQDLAALGVFAAVRVRAAEKLDAEGRLPVTIDFAERKRHTVSLAAAYSTDLGGSVTASWSDRNLFGNAETLTLSAAATELGGTESKQPGYNVGAAFSLPDWLVRDQTLQFTATALKEYLQTYDRTAFIVGSTVSRKITPNLTATIGLTVTEEKVVQEEVARTYTLVALPIGIKFDDTDNLFEPTRGFRASATVTPTESLGGQSLGRQTPSGQILNSIGGNAGFVITQLTGSAYLSLGEPGRSVLALRALLGSAGGASQFELPPDQRFYGGGSGTIRGYKYQYVSPQFPDGTPAGGTAIDAATIEFRQRIFESYGAAVFADAGQVGTSALPFTGKLRVGAGIGARYYTPIGPIRLDFALPLIRQPGSDAFEVYIGIGEAF